MKFIYTLFILSLFSFNCLAQGGDGQDSVRRARIEQMQRMMQERQQQQGAGNAQQGTVRNAGDVRQGSVQGTDIAPPPPNNNQDFTAPPPAERLSGSITSQATVTVTLDDESARLGRIATQLEELEYLNPAYREEVDISVGRLPLSELLRNVAKIGGVNLSVRGVDDMMVSVNFSRARIVELIYFLCKEYGLDADVTGNIVSIFPKRTAPPPPKEIIVRAGAAPGTITYELANDNLAAAAKRITEVSGANILVPQSLYGRTVSGFVKDMAVDEAVMSLAGGNGLLAKKSNNGIWELSAPAENGGGTYSRRSAFGSDQLLVDSLGFITAQITRGSVSDIIADLCGQMGFNHYFLTPINHQVSVFLTGVTFETLLGVILAGTEYGYRLEEGIYLFGTFSRETLGSVRIIPLMYRSVSKVEDIIPKQLSEGLEVCTFVDQNSIIASGDQRMVQRLESFLRSIDKRVPLVTIEVMIMDVKKIEIMEAGLGLGVGEAPVTTTGKLSPGIDMNLGASSINSIINSFNGFGSINLGRVTPQFYMNLKMLEDNGTIQIHSTPKLSTLNGNPASLSSGEKSYYKEVQTNFWGSQTPTPSESYVWKETEANLEVKITPFVSADKQITLDIEIVQSEFTERVEQDGPPGMASRSFKSIIRVQDEEMVLLGGIDRNYKTVSNKGLPFIARIPVLKWIFGTSKKDKTDHKLNVFIKPTLIE